MIQLFSLPILTLIILFFFGSGLSLLFTPKKIKDFSFWLAPWYTIVFLIITLTPLSLARVSVAQASPFLIAFLLGVNFVAFFRKKLQFTFKRNYDLLLAFFIIFSIFLNLSPLIKRDKFATTISMGNNDVIVYTQTPEYLRDKSVGEYLQTKIDNLKPAEMGVGNLVYHGYRWGTPILTSFFITLLGLPGYQYAYIFQAVLFSLSIPLIYLLFRTLYKESILGLILSTSLFGLNANALYMLYHNFAGQIVFWGLELLLLIFFFNYFNSDEEKDSFINKWDYLIGLTTGALYMAYHEAMVFIFPPLFIYFVLRLLTKQRIINLWNTYLKFLFVALVVSAISIANSVIIDFLQAADIDDPIGWAPFRKGSSFANPFELLGFQSIHGSEPLPILMTVILSLAVIYVIYVGVKKIKNQHLLLSFFSIYLLFIVWTSILHHNFFAYNRVITYALPLVATVFTIGLLEVIKLKNYLVLVPAVLLSLVYYSALALNTRFINERIVVDKELISLKEIHKVKDINEPIYTEQVLTGLMSYWKQVWMDYFTYPKATYTPFNYDWANKPVPDSSLILISKPPKIILNQIVWENDYYQLGRLCNSDQCILENIKGNLSEVVVGKSNYEASLLLKGWNADEGGHRWAIAKASTLRLKTGEGFYPTKLVIEAVSLKKPQTLQIFIDEAYIGEIKLEDYWKTHEINLNFTLNPGIHYLRIEHSNSYRPVDLELNTDTRELYVDYKRISLE